MNMRTTTAALAFLAASVSALAEVKLNENFSAYGYAAASYRNIDVSPGTSDSDGALDTALLGLNFKQSAVSGVLSGLYTHNGFDEFAVLDAYLTIKANDEISLTAGKFLSYMGYESFYPIYMDQITFANGDFLAPIPGYHTGIRIDHSTETSSAGIAVVDSVYSPYSAVRGDAEIDDNVGFEIFYSYKGVKDLVLWFGFAADTAGGFQGDNGVTMFDFWASYKVSDKVRVAAEYAIKNGGPGAKGYNWLGFLNYTINEKVNCTFRVSGEKLDAGGPGFTRYTVSPAYVLNEHFTVRAEYTHTSYTNSGIDNANYFGVQTVLKF